MSCTKTLPVPTFEKSIVQHHRTDGYWIETYWVDPDDKVPGLIGYGLGVGDICIFDNPLNGGPKEDDGGWKSYCVKKLNSPVAVATGDCAGAGRNDIVICYEYGQTFLTANPQGGDIIWLENPGRCKEKKTLKTEWKERTIGRWPAMHRLKSGYFTQRSILELVALPIVNGLTQGDINTAVPVILFQKPEKSLDALEWNRSIIDDECFTVIHEATPKKFKSQGGRDSLFIASRSGIDWMYWEDSKWKREHITDGVEQKPGMDYYGSACVDVGKLGNDPSAYIMTIDPFHGGVVSVVTKQKTGPDSHIWTRKVLDVYGPGHYVVCGDFDGDGDDECLIAMMGPSPYKGIFYYKCIDLEKKVFAKWKISGESAARLAIGDFNNHGRLDVATISYNVEKYYEEPNPTIRLYTNKTVENANSPPRIIGTVWGGEALYYVPKPTELTCTSPQTTPLMNVAGYIMSLEIHPPNTSVPTTKGDAIKVLYGECSDGEFKRRALSVPANEKSSTLLIQEKLDISKEGCILMRIRPENPYDPNKPALAPPTSPHAEDTRVKVENLFEFSYPELALPKPLKWTRVEDLEWGSSFEGEDFSNMTGIDFRFLDGTHLCHVQYWTIGRGTSAGVHNHADETFLEVHLCLVPGTGEATGMWRVPPDYPVDPNDPNAVPADKFIKLPLGELEQQGGFWERDRDGKHIWLDNGAIKYPWHKWQADDTANGLDVWIAFEYNPEVEL
ncbi:hypothetical protein DFP73DRAFT_630662 [Morchella snyderi]|nr:hypothetical protein DFP73DRAFT_630662 [Morchella snyderi]